MTSFTSVFHAIADEKRQKMLSLLEERDMCVGELVKRFHLTQPAVSKHLAVLRNAGLVNDRRCGMQVVYSLNRENIKNCCLEYFNRFECCSALFADSPGAARED